MRYVALFVPVAFIVWISKDHWVISRSQNRNSNSTRMFYVVPDEDIGKCHQSECHTLAFYMNSSSRTPSSYFNSYDTYKFWYGNHSPLANSTLVVENITNLTFIGLPLEGNKTAAIIDCNEESFGFVFKSSSNITIDGLIFSSCIRNYSTSTGGPHPLATLAFLNGYNLFLGGVTLQGSVDEAIYVRDIQGIIHFKELVIVNARSKFSRNMNVIFNSKCKNESLQLIIEDSIFYGNFMPANDDTDQSIDNHPLAAGLSITLQCVNVNVRIENVTMRNNSGGNGGSLGLMFHNTSSTLNNTVTIRNSILESSRAIVGAALYAEFVEGSESEETLCLHTLSKSEHQLLYVENTTFTNNSAKYAGGAVYLKQKQSKASCSIGKITFVNCTFQHNSVTRKGFGGTTLHSINYPITGYKHHGVPQFKTLLEECIFKENYAEPHNASEAGNGVIFTKADSYFKLVNVSISNNNSTGILAIGSNIILSGNITIAHNRGSSGGGLMLCQNAVTYFDPNSTIVIAYNHVKHTGGGISVETECLQSRPMCFFQLNESIHFQPELIHTVRVLIYNNTAEFAGHNLFGGSVDHCFMLDGPDHHHNASKSIDVYRSIFNFPKGVNSSVTSEPQQVCFCENGKKNCLNNGHLRNIEQYPGETFTIKAVLVGQLYGTVPGTVQARLKSDNTSSASLKTNEKVQKIGSNSSCGNLNYTIYSNYSKVQIQLSAQHSGDISGYEHLNQFRRLNVNVTMKKCPPGFALFNNVDSHTVYCDCIDLLKEYQIKCDITKQQIHRKPPVWIGYVNSTNTILVHAHCPFDYCSTDTDIKLNVTDDSLNQDKQCMHQRTGVLCGACSYGLSVMLGSCECRSCSNYWLLLLIVFAISGVLVLLLLTVINMTITEGTLGGLLFYCNIINSNITLFFPEPTCPFLTPLLKTFVSSLSFTLSGIPLCLYDGMNAYSVAWLSFVYPLYIWLIAGLLILLGNKFSKLVRHNSVKVLATLIILSYSTLLHTVIEALQVTYLHHDNGRGDYLWLKDGNIKYFKGKHIALVIFASLFGLILLPFTFCLLCIQCLFKVSHYRMFLWVNRLKPFFDAYTGPFTASGRFWTGLLLLARIVIYVVSATNFTSDQEMNVGAIGLTSFILLFTASMLAAGLYKQRSLNILEHTLLFNLGLLSTFTICSKYKTSIEIVTHVCVGIAFFTFIGVILYHVKFLKVLRRATRYIWLHVSRRQVQHEDLSDEDDYDQGMHSRFPPLAQFDQTREPLLD